VNNIRIKTIIMALTIFMVGWMCSNIYGSANYDTPDNVEFTSNTGFFSSFFSKSAGERISPHDWVNESQIHVTNDKVIIDISNPEWAGFTDTNSMDPIIDKDANAIQIVPRSKDMIHVGDIVSYKSDFTEGTIIHRVIETGEDEEGWYAIIKGDNLNNVDPGKVRFDQIKRVLVAVIY